MTPRPPHDDPWFSVVIVWIVVCTLLLILVAA